MRKRRRTKLTLAGMIVTLACLPISCDSTEVIDPPPLEEEPGTVVFAAAFPPDGDMRLVLAPFNNPNEYRIYEDLYAFDPRLSPDKSKIILQGYREDHIQSAYLYEVEKDTAMALVDVNAVKHLLYYKDGTTVWDAPGNGFYFSKRDGIAPVSSTYYHAVGDSSIELINDQLTPVELIDQDTLLVKNHITFSLLDLKTDRLSPLNNPHLSDLLSSVGSSLDWSQQRRLFVFRDSEEGSRRSRIAITNLDGSFYQEVTSGEFNDHSPRWGPENMVLFLRADPTFPPRAPSSLMLVNIETDEVQTFLCPEDLGAQDLHDPDY